MFGYRLRTYELVFVVLTLVSLKPSRGEDTPLVQYGKLSGGEAIQRILPSPDQKFIAFITPTKTYIKETKNLVARMVLNSTTIAWNPKRPEILYWEEQTEQLKLVNVQTTEEKAISTRHHNIDFLNFSHGGEQLFVANRFKAVEDLSVKDYSHWLIYDWAGANELGPVAKSLETGGSPNVLALSPTSSRYVAAVGEQLRIRHFDDKESGSSNQMDGNEVLKDLAFSPNGQILFVLKEGAVQLKDMKSYADILQKLPEVESFSLSPDGKRLALASAKRLYFYDIAWGKDFLSEGALLKTYLPPVEKITALKFLNNEHLLSVDSQGQGMVWKAPVSKGKKLPKLTDGEVRQELESIWKQLPAYFGIRNYDRFYDALWSYYAYALVYKDVTLAFIQEQFDTYDGKAPWRESKPLKDYVRELQDKAFRTREAASRKVTQIWRQQHEGIRKALEELYGKDVPLETRRRIERAERDCESHDEDPYTKDGSYGRQVRRRTLEQTLFYLAN